MVEIVRHRRDLVVVFQRYLKINCLLPLSFSFHDYRRVDDVYSVWTLGISKPTLVGRGRVLCAFVIRTAYFVLRIMVPVDIRIIEHGNENEHGKEHIT